MSESESVSVPQNAPAKRTSPSVAFVRRHDKFLSIIGAGLVLLTFIVKEGMRETLKDQSDRLASAETEYLNAERVDEMGAELHTMNEDVERLKGYVFQQNFPSSRVVTYALAAISDYKNSGARFVDEDRTFRQYLSKDELSKEKYDAKLKDLEAKAKADQVALSEPLAMLSSILFAYSVQMAMDEEYYLGSPIGSPMKKRAPPPDTIEDPQPLADAIHSVTNASRDIDKLSSKLSDDERECLKAGRTILEEKERNFRRATRVLYGTFALGWVLGLIGRIYEVKGLSVSD